MLRELYMHILPKYSSEDDMLETVFKWSVYSFIFYAFSD